MNRAMLSKNRLELRGEHQSVGGPRAVPTERPAPPAVSEVPVQPEHQVILLVGSDADLLFLRSAVLASAGIWSLRVRNADQAIELLRKVPCDMAVICYTLDQENQQQLLTFLLNTQCSTKVLWMVPGDDCSGTGFLMKIEDALQDRPPVPVSWRVPNLPNRLAKQTTTASKCTLRLGSNLSGATLYLQRT